MYELIMNKINVLNLAVYDLNNHIEKHLNEFKNIDDMSSIKMYDFFCENYKKHRLFMGRGYPSSFFFFNLSNKILNKLNFLQNDVFEDTHCFENATDHIHGYMYKYLKLEFDNVTYMHGHHQVSEIEHFYMLFLINHYYCENIDMIETELNFIRR
jgi:hypothetical protein